MTNFNNVRIFADKIRLETCKEYIAYGAGHIGGCMSITDTLAVLFYDKMRIDPKNPDWDGRDYFAMSKGHAGPAYYAALALKGFFPLDLLKTLNQDGTILATHANHNYIPGADCTTGSLGQGASQAVGIAWGLKVQHKDNRVYCVIGDGEANEGQVWEVVQFARGKNLDNFVLFVDDNKKQLDGAVQDINLYMDFEKIFKAFGWHTQKIDGGDVEQISKAIDIANNEKGSPSVIILDTIKGKGIPFLETSANCHHVNCDEKFIENIKPLMDKWEAETYEG